MRKGLTAIGSIVGIDECVLFAGLILLSIGLWPLLDCIALSVPGAVLIWLALPSRAAFIQKPNAEPTRRKRT